MTTCAPKCETCYSSSLSTCKECTLKANNTRATIDSNCICKAGFFEVGGPECMACVSPCKTC